MGRGAGARVGIVAVLTVGLGGCLPTPADDRITVTEEQPRRREVSIAYREQVAVVGEVPGATVFLDGQELGPVPVEVSLDFGEVTLSQFGLQEVRFDRWITVRERRERERQRQREQDDHRDPGWQTDDWDPHRKEDEQKRESNLFQRIVGGIAASIMGGFIEAVFTSLFVESEARLRERTSQHTGPITWLNYDVVTDIEPVVLRVEMDGFARRVVIEPDAEDPVLRAAMVEAGLTQQQGPGEAALGRRRIVVVPAGEAPGPDDTRGPLDGGQLMREMQRWIREEDDWRRWLPGGEIRAPEFTLDRYTDTPEPALNPTRKRLDALEGR